MSAAASARAANQTSPTVANATAVIVSEAAATGRFTGGSVR